ncbi:MAG: D-alanyl-D-alanine carboxypeptidase [Rhodospirillales bacterium]|nr:D-alanyl-D-alanine carboxypeptidase [Alphaproteobacteria bacterium]MCB9986043.1 D-alanyl-D-alanine carboxypeptidase [Rhodospirillales bacterium]USO07386.1 MAG: D-alanyl-D-alanine carboxypeptidase [Rhodospirillales bacterium]
MKIFTLVVVSIFFKLSETKAPEVNVELKTPSVSTIVHKSAFARFFVLALAVLATLLAGFGDADAATKKKSRTHHVAPKATQTKPYAAIVVDAQTGEVLMARQADSIRHPASLTKMMTLYMLFEAIDAGRIRMNDRIVISSHAASMAPSKLGLPAGQSLNVEDAIQALVTKSANDVAAAIAEKLSGNESRFCARMSRKAHDLGMSRTSFHNASGLPDDRQVTSARDMAKLAIALLRDFPHYYHYFGVRDFEFRGQTLVNHNRLLGEYPGLDGIKTGYINDSGFNLVASAKQNGRRLVGVVFGGRTWRSRNEHMVALLDEGFAEIRRRGRNIRVASAPAAIAPIPLPPPMMDEDTRGVETAMMTSADDETDSAEEGLATTPEDSARVESMIDRVAQQGTDDGMGDGMAPPIPSPRPAALAVSQTPAAVARPNQAAAAAAVAALRSTNARAASAQRAPVVMQLRIPRSQLPKGVAPSQIVSNGGASRISSIQPASGGAWSIQVGAFPSRAMTDQALRTAQARLPAHLQQQGQPVIVPQATGGGVIFRARLQGYDEISANAACAHLGSCLVVAPGS